MSRHWTTDQMVRNLEWDLGRGRLVQRGELIQILMDRLEISQPTAESYIRRLEKSGDLISVKLRDGARLEWPTLPGQPPLPADLCYDPDTKRVVVMPTSSRLPRYLWLYTLASTIGYVHRQIVPEWNERTGGLTVDDGALDASRIFGVPMKLEIRDAQLVISSPIDERGSHIEVLKRLRAAALSLEAAEHMENAADLEAQARELREPRHVSSDKYPICDTPDAATA